MMISWTYLLHAHYRKQSIEYRYFRKEGRRKRFDKTTKGAIKYWEIERCLNHAQSPVDVSAANNLRFLIGLRHEIEHQMTTRIDQFLSARFQACCLNYNDLIKTLFGDSFGIDKHLSFSLQLSSLNKEQVDKLSQASGLPENIRAYITEFDLTLTDKKFNDPKFFYRVFFVPKTANHKGQAEQVIEFIKPGSEMAEGMNTKYIQIKETERPKHLPSKIVKLVQRAGYKRFTMRDHTLYWQTLEAKNPGKGMGVLIGTTSYWYETWLNEVLTACKDGGCLYR